MGMQGNINLIRVSQTGITVTTGASNTSQSLSALTTADGKRARLATVCCTAAAHINFSKGAGTATANDLLITTTPVIIDITGYDNMNHIQEGSAAKVTITPLEM